MSILLILELDAKVSTTEITNNNVTVTVNSDDENFDYILLPDGTKISEKTASFVVSQNGEYTFIAYDKAGNKSSKIVSVNNIKSKDLDDKPTETGQNNSIFILFLVGTISIIGMKSNLKMVNK